MSEPSAKDYADAAEIARFGGLTGAQGEGLAQIVAVIRTDAAKAERERVSEALKNHRKRDELVVAALQAVVESGCATGSAVGLAQRVLAIYEEVPCG